MSASDLNQEVLAQLASGDFIAPQESAKRRVATLVQLIDEPLDGSRTRDDLRVDLLGRWDPACIELLAIFFPLLEYGDENALTLLPRCMHQVAGATAVANEDRGWNRQCGVVVVGRLIWALTAFSLHCRRLGGLAALSRVSVRAPYRNRRVEPLITNRELRYPGALGQSAGHSYDNYREWLLALGFVEERYELFARELTESFDEADLLLAMRAALDGGRVYSAALDTKSIQRLADHALDPLCRPSLATTFRTSDEQLNETLEQAYSGVETDPHQWDRPTSVFGNDD